MLSSTPGGQLSVVRKRIIAYPLKSGKNANYQENEVENDIQKVKP
jgi:hypothetical protein